MKRINSRLNSAAYRKNRSTTKLVFVTKLIIERTISLADETVYLLLLDKSKTLTVYRETY